MADLKPGEMNGDRHSTMIPRLILLIGLPGSGKSTLARHLVVQHPSRRLISTDSIRSALFGDEAHQGSWSLIWDELGQQFRDAATQIRQGTAHDAIYDATNAVRRQRRQVMALARSCGFQKLVGLWLDVPLEVCLERNQTRDRQVPEAVIQRMHQCLRGAPPSLNEGFKGLNHYGYLGTSPPR